MDVLVQQLELGVVRAVYTPGDNSNLPLVLHAF
jgi:hypothetical protein